MLVLFVVWIVAVAVASRAQEKPRAPMRIALSHMPGKAAHPALGKRDGAQQSLPELNTPDDSSKSMMSVLTLNMTIETPPQYLAVPIDLGLGRSGFRNLVMYYWSQEPVTDDVFSCGSQWMFLSDNSSTFALSSERVRPIENLNLPGIAAHDIVTLNEITLKNQTIVMLEFDQMLWAFVARVDLQEVGIESQVEDMMAWEHLWHPVGGAGFEPNSEFARDLLPGRAGEIGLFIAAPNPNAPGWTNTTYYNHNAGEMTIGGLNEELYSGEVNYLPVVNDSAWEVSLGGLKVGGQVVDLRPSPTAHFHISRDIYMKESLANRTMAHISGSKFTKGLFTVPCKTAKNLTFTFGGRDYAMPLEISPLTGSKGCVARIQPLNDTAMTADVYLGSPFLSTVYTALQYGNGTTTRIGFADLSDAARAIVPEPVSPPGTTIALQPTTNSSAGVTVSVGWLAVALAVLGSVL